MRRDEKALETTIPDLDGHDMALAVSRAMGKATALLKEAADAGDADAQFSLGLLYLIGRGVEENFDEAFKLFGLAERGGNEEAARFRKVAGEQLARAHITDQLHNEAIVAAMMDAKRRQLFPRPKLIKSDC